MRKLVIIVLLSIVQFYSYGQEKKDESKFGSQIFLPSIEMGYTHSMSPLLSGGILTKTSIEYRIRNNNDIFLRVNYDNYSGDYSLIPTNGFTNVIEGTASLTDLLGGVGYRFGDKKVRFFIMAQAGITYYNFPQATSALSSVVNIKQGKKNVMSSRATLGVEYYFTEKSAFSFDILQNQIWKKQDFWEDNGSSIGFSIGFLTSLF